MNIGEIPFSPVSIPHRKSKQKGQNKSKGTNINVFQSREKTVNKLLTLKTQNKLSETNIKLIGDITGFVEKVKLNNQEHSRLSPAELNNPNKLSIFSKRKIEQESSLKDLSNRINIYSEILKRDISRLEEQTMTWKMEKESTQEAITGYDSLLGGAWYQRYGMNHRLSQIDAEMEKKQKQLVAELVQAKESTLNQAVIPSEHFEESENILKAIKKLSKLKEELLITGEALRKIKSADLANIYFIHHSNELVYLQEGMISKLPQKLGRLAKIDDEIKYGTDLSYIQVLQEEKQRITDGYNMIEHRVKEIKDLLEARSTEFKLNKDAKSPEIHSVPQTEAMRLMRKIISFKETLMPYAGSGGLSLTEKQSVFEQQVRDLKLLKEKKQIVEQKDFSPLNTKINDALAYLPILQERLETVEKKKTEMDNAWTIFKNLKLTVDDVQPKPVSLTGYLNPLSYFSTSLS